MDILEKHGPHAPIDSDLIHVHEWSATATKKICGSFPRLFYGQINEARQQYGTFSLPSKLVWELLDATCEEIARNEFNKIVIVYGHGGNPQLIRYFIQSQLERKRDYAIYFFDPTLPAEVMAKQIRKSDLKGDQHGGENETSSLLYLRPELVKMETATNESGANQKRLDLNPDLYTAIWWYASYPNHYTGEGAEASREVGEVITEAIITALAKAIKSVKADTQTLQLQNEYFDRMEQ